MIGLTIIALSFLEALEVFLVDVIGLELLSLARIGLGLGRVLYCYFILSPSWFIRESCENPRD
jgi:hypothetical protein